jgi:hypothetical protein
MNFPCTAALEGSVFTIKLEVILGCITFIGKFRFLESVEGKTLGGKEENAFTTTTGENVNEILWGRKIIYSASIVEERREYIRPFIAGQRRECIHQTIYC